MPRPDLTKTVRRLERAAGGLATQSVARMDETLPWFRSMPADQRSWVTLVAQAGIAALTEWLRQPPGDHPAITGDVFGAAPRYLARAVTLQQVVAMVKVTVEVVEGQVAQLAARGEETALREAVLVFSREVAFSAAHVYARAAEDRGSWDARLQSLLVDTLVRGGADSGELLTSQAAALGWSDSSPVVVVVGPAPAAQPGGPGASPMVDALSGAARRTGLEVLGAVQGDRLVLAVGGATEPVRAATALLSEFGPGPVVVGTPVESLATADASARAALAGYRAAAAWPGAPRPVTAAELVPERVLAGDPDARRELEAVYAELAGAGAGLLDTLATYLDAGGTLEGTARLLFVHPNTVRYRLRRVAEVCGLSPTEPRDAFCLRLALAYGRLDLAAL